MSYYDMDPSDYMDEGEMRETDEEAPRSCENCEHLMLVGCNYGGLCDRDGCGVTLDYKCMLWEARI